MGLLSESISSAIALIANCEPEVMSAVGTSLIVSVNSTLLAALAGVPAGFYFGTHNFRGKSILTASLHTLTAMPTVVVGLIAYSAFTARGPLGGMSMLYTRTAMVFGLFLLIIPLMTSLSLAATQSIHTGIRDTALTLGATPFQAAMAVFREGRFAYLTAVATCFGRSIGEVGVAMMLGGNIKGVTRTMTTALALETEKGEFPVAVALGMILLVIALCVNALLHFLKARSERI